jgi:uncharacterized RmlC-like cupin family protein
MNQRPILSRLPTERSCGEGFMRIIDHGEHEREPWRPGVLTRMRVSARTGAAQLCIFEQWCDPGSGAPTHLHAVEEVLTVLAGQAEVWVSDERAILSVGDRARRLPAWVPECRRDDAPCGGGTRRADIRSCLR